MQGPPIEGVECVSHIVLIISMKIQTDNYIMFLPIHVILFHM